jgi:diguanylate cyclase (GGDEF)-like protein
MRAFSPSVWFRLQFAALRAQPMLAMLIGAVIVALFVADGALVFYLRNQAIAFGEREAGNLSYALAQQTEKSLQVAHLIASVIAERIEAANPSSVEEFEEAARSVPIRDMLQGSITGFGQLDNLAIASARGKLVARGVAGPLPSLDLSDREYIAGARNSSARELYISTPVKSLITGEWSIFLAKRVSSVSGEFLGVVTGVIELSTLEKVYSKIAVGEHGSIWMARRDGTLLVRYPRVEKVIGRSFDSRGPLAELFLKGEEGVARHLSPTDGRQRLAALHYVHDFPVAIVVTAAIEDVLTEWRGQVLCLAIVGLSAALALVLLALILASATEQLAQTRSELDVSRAHEKAQGLFTAAISNMRQGLAMFDADENLIVCNRQYAELYRLSPDILAPNTPRHILLQQRALAGTQPLTRTITNDRHRLNELEDGRTITISHAPITGGGFVSTHEDITDQRRAEEKILRLAQRDTLTELPNRMVFKQTLNARIEGLSPGERLAVHYLDLDGFKLVNDTLGHTAGDVLLQKVARRLSTAVRSTDTLARLGGDEFAILQTVTSPEEAQGLAVRLNELLSKLFDVDGHRIRIGSSVGVSLAPDDALDPDQLVKNADMALYAAKGAGRNTYRFFRREIEDAMRERVRLEAELRDALPCGQLELFYQPQVRLDNAELIGFEALLRWHHPERGLLTPASFIELAEETGLIKDIGEWVILQACLEAVKWPDHLRIAVNLSVVQLQTSSLCACVEDALAATGLRPDRLELEVTESVMLKHAESNVSMLLALRTLGLRISMDDFGTGYSSLSGLRLFPFDKLKIDRSFVSELGTRKDCAAIVASVASLANSLGMSTTAEGIETDEQWAQAKLAGCTEGQGYLFGAPMPASRIAELTQCKLRA